MEWNTPKDRKSAKFSEYCTKSYGEGRLRKEKLQWHCHSCRNNQNSKCTITIVSMQHDNRRTRYKDELPRYMDLPYVRDIVSIRKRLTIKLSFHLLEGSPMSQSAIVMFRSTRDWSKGTGNRHGFPKSHGFVHNLMDWPFPILWSKPLWWSPNKIVNFFHNVIYVSAFPFHEGSLILSKLIKKNFS